MTSSGLETMDGDRQSEVCAAPGCGHPRSEHYTYLLNNKPVMRCRACDPVAYRRGDYARTHEEALRSAVADHEFAEV